MSDRIRVEGLAVLGSVGVYPHERQARQRLVIDLELEADLGLAGRSDRLSDTLDYAEAARVAREVVTERHHQLIESIAETIAERLLAGLAGRVQAVRVRVGKPHALADARMVAVEIERRTPPS